jgi:hypothetical protein
MLVIPSDMGLKTGLKTADVYYTSPSSFQSEAGGNCDIVRFIQSPVPSISWPFSEFHTFHIDLSKPITELHAALSKTARYEIRRREREGATNTRLIRHPTAADIDDFCSRYRRFRESKGLDERQADAYRETMTNLAKYNAIVVTRGWHDGREETMCQHSYIFDGTRARLQKSASLFRYADAKTRQLMSEVHRFLTWTDITTFKDLQANIYDLGGVPRDQPGTVNEFKGSFGGTIVCEYMFYHPISAAGQTKLASIEGLRERLSTCTCSICLGRKEGDSVSQEATR